MKLIVTHFSPDIDALTACWLIKRFLKGWDEAEIKFIPAGSALNNKPPDDNPEIIHVDTGLGKFDHHQTDSFISASQLVLDHLLKNKFISSKDHEPLIRLVKLVTEFDHFQEYFYPEPYADRYNFLLHETIEGLKKVTRDDHVLLNTVFKLLDGTLLNLKNKVSAEKDIKTGYIFTSNLGNTLIMFSGNAESGKLAMKMGYRLVITKDPDKGYVRLKCPPEKGLDLTPFYKKLLQFDPKANWFLHSSKKMILNGSAKNPGMKPSFLSVPKLIEIVKSV